jgi:hypothetical protein
MTNSNDKCKITAIIDEIFELLDADYLHQTIDGPIEEAVESFEFDAKAQMTFHSFVKVIGDFVAHIYRFGPGVVKILSATQARSEALFIVENGYRSADDRGFDAAYLDATDTEINGIENVLQQMANDIKEKARTRHIKWVYATRLNPLDWKIQCSITRTLLQQEKQYIPPDILACHPDQLTSCIANLVESLISVSI